ncbi:MAG: hypothetical protein U9P88_01885 [Patescibacteria group bacterium]|nr:hypothetical protein [Patescibacteria group bacterium]
MKTHAFQISILIKWKKELIEHFLFKKNYCFYTKLLSGEYYCANDRDLGRKTSIYPDGTVYCDGKTFICS